MHQAQQRYVGRFAPSPTGPLHLGSLVTAMASYLEARANRGHWLLRIEDVDRERCSKTAEREILSQLHAYGFEHDGEIVRQSDAASEARYEATLAQLTQLRLIYGCDCTRAILATAPRSDAGEIVYPGTCSNKGLLDSSHQVAIANTNARSALRFRTTGSIPELLGSSITFNERGNMMVADPRNDIGDFIIKRSNGQFAYQLAVVVDDYDAGVTHIVRGADLFSNTGRQVALIRALGFDDLQYFHVPIVLNDVGEKLSKQTKAVPIAVDNALATLHNAWVLLKQTPIVNLNSVREFWRQAVAAWSPDRIARHSALEKPRDSPNIRK